MTQSTDTRMPFHELLDHCSSPGSPHWQRAWKEFIQRYKQLIYKVVTNRCLKYNIPAIRRQLSDVVNDIFSEVITQLCVHDCRALRDYRNRDNERIFVSWLAIICNRISNEYLQKHFLGPLIDKTPEEFPKLIGSLALDLRWQLYEDHVRKLRNLQKPQKRNLERDINIFKLYVWSGFSAQMIASVPCYEDLGHRVIDNVVNRMRAYLRKMRES